jgi:hypothetical protein
MEAEMSLFDKMNTPVFLKEDSDAREYISNLEKILDKANANEQLKERIEREIKIASIGLYGEDNIAFELKNCNMGIYILRDLHIQIDDLSAQIDFAVVTRKFTLFIECKNLIGDIEIDKEGNFIRTYTYNKKSVREGIYSPITQSQRHLDVMKRHTMSRQNNKFMTFAVDKLFNSMYKSVVVLANPKTILKDRYAPKDIKNKVIRADQIGQYIKKMYNDSNDSPVNDKSFLIDAQKLLDKHQPKDTDYLKKYYDVLEETNRTEFNNNIEKQLKVENSKDVANYDKLYEELKKFRLEKSRRENIKPYFIFNNKQLDHLIEIMPQNHTDLLKVNGFGEVKVEKYGDEILAIISNI